MGAYYRLKTKSLEDDVLVVQVTIIEPSEEEFYVKKSVALQYIWTKSHAHSATPPLLEFIPVNNILDKQWVAEHAGDYIRSVSILETQNYPADDFGITDEDFFKLPDEKLPQALYRIETTDAKWLVHLPIGHEWESAAYDMESLL